MKFKKAATLGAAALSLVMLSACGTAPPSAGGGSSSKLASAKSAKDAGGMDKLVAAAKKEGQLNVIALPPDWANYGEIIKKFESKYDIKVNSAQPDAASQDEINAAKRLKGRPTAPDVFDLSQAVALANTKMFAEYKVETFDDIPSDLKDQNGRWTNDYGGYMSIGYDSKKVSEVTKLEDLLKPEYKGKVALNGDPTQAGAAFAGVVMAAVANGGKPGKIAPGVDFFKKLKQAGNFIPVDPTPTTIESGQTPVVIDWDYTNAAETAKLPSWKVMVPDNAVVGGYYFQAINADAPHPAAARLWQEFLFSEEGQNLYLKGGARPVLASAMEKAGTIDKAAYAKLPKVTAKPVLPTADESTKDADYLAKNWANAVK